MSFLESQAAQHFSQVDKKPVFTGVPCIHPNGQRLLARVIGMGISFWAMTARKKLAASSVLWAGLQANRCAARVCFLWNKKGTSYTRSVVASAAGIDISFRATKRSQPTKVNCKIGVWTLSAGKCWQKRYPAFDANNPLIIAHPFNPIRKVCWVSRQNFQNVLFVQFYSALNFISFYWVMAYFICQQISKKSVIKDFFTYRNSCFSSNSIFDSLLQQK